MGGASAVSGYAEVLNRAAVVTRRKNDARTRRAFVAEEEGVLVMPTCLCMGSADVRMDSQVLGWRVHQWRRCAVAGRRAR